MHFHWQNLNTDRDDRPKGSGLRHGRAWLHLSKHVELGVEWRVPSRSFNLGFGISGDGERTVSVSLCVPPTELYLSLESWALGRSIHQLAERFHLRTEDDWGDFERELSIRIFSWALWWNLWRNPHVGRPRDPRNGSWHPFGHPGSVLTERVEVERREVDVPMPEKTYRAIATRETATTRGTHTWPFSRPRVSIVKLDFEPFEPVPLPGKGENSWDIDQDAIYSSSGGADTIEEKIGKFVASTLERRLRYGGRSWKPKPKAEAQVSA